MTWQWQLTGRIDVSVVAQVYDLDGQTTPGSTVAALHAQGRRVICYVSVGSWEKFRPDAAAFPAAVLGKALDGWPDERWLDVRRLDLLRPLVAARFDQCRAKGFDAVEPDNVDGYLNRSGFPLTAAHQLAYNRAIADLAHERGLAVGLKNDLDQVAALQPRFDFAVNEQCHQYDECELLRPFVAAGKPVLHVEYEQAPSAFCGDTTSLGFSSMRKRLDLDAWRRACP
ncbi:MAG: endo alpha-1,4 polygalactosaminidase [Kineosporiaceae bacterium]